MHSSTNGHRPPKISATVQSITPEIAAQMLGTMANNRRVRRRNVEQFAREMITGNWHLNGEPLIFAEDGHLIDGQHRLRAVEMSKTTVQMLVVRGVHQTAMTTIDTGAMRNYGDVTTLRGESNGTAMASIARLWFMYDNSETLTAKPSLSHQEIDKILAQHPTIAAAGSRANRSPFRRHWPRSVLGFTYAFLAERDGEEFAELFVSTVEKGANLEEDNPIFALRRRLIESERRPTRSILALTIKAYNEWYEGAKVKVLIFRSDEPFPRFGVSNKEARGIRRRRHSQQTPAVAEAVP